MIFSIIKFVPHFLAIGIIAGALMFVVIGFIRYNKLKEDNTILKENSVKLEQTIEEQEESTKTLLDTLKKNKAYIKSDSSNKAENLQKRNKTVTKILKERKNIYDKDYTDKELGILNFSVNKFFHNLLHKFSKTDKNNKSE